MELTEKQQTWLEDLVFKGEATTEVSIINDNVTITLSSLNGSKQLEVESKIGASTGTALYVMHTYSLLALSYALKKFTAKDMVVEFKDQPTAFEFVKSRPAVIIDAMIKAQSDFEAELKKITSPEVVQENFSKTPGTEEGSSSI